VALIKTTEEDKIEIVGEYKAIQIRQATIISEDGTEISRTFNRRVIHPSVKSGDNWVDYDTSSESAEVQGIASAVWSDAVKAAYQNAMDAATPSGGSE